MALTKANLNYAHIKLFLIKWLIEILIFIEIIHSCRYKTIRIISIDNVLNVLKIKCT